MNASGRDVRAFLDRRGFRCRRQSCECAALSNRLINSPSGMSRLTATMSARWTATSASVVRAGRCCGMVRSIAEKPTRPASTHRARPADRRGPIPASSRTACANGGSASAAGGRTQHLAFRDHGRQMRVARLSWWDRIRHVSHPVRWSRSAYGSGMPSCARISRSRLSILRRRRLSDRNRSDAGSLHRKMAEMMIERLLFVVISLRVV